MRRLRKITHCSVPGHGTRCYAHYENDIPNFYNRKTEKHLAFKFEEMSRL